MTLLTASPPQTAPPALVREAAGSRLAHRARLYVALALLLLPTVGATILFTYYPQISAVKYAFFRWDGQEVEEYRGLDNFRRAWNDHVFWSSFQLTFILLLANMAKMWPSIFTAVVLHRIRSERWQYIYRVLFVIPMIIPGLVGLLIWKSFYDPQGGVLNKFLTGTGLIHLLKWADSAMPAMTHALLPLRHALIDRVFGSTWGLATLGLVLLMVATEYRQLWRRLAMAALALALAWAVWVLFQGQTAHFALWMFLAFAVPLTVRWRYGPAAQQTLARGLATACLVLAALSVLTTMLWTEPVYAFDNGQPTWLGNEKLVIPAMIFWGFPWVGTVGVLIYLAGLQSISTDVYEAAELDGVSSAGRLFRIELPLILTQVRINLVFMTIGTLTDYGLLLLLLGPNGGPGKVGMVPGLYAYQQAFYENEYGYACALGMVMFLIILGITVVYQKIVKIDK